MIVATVVMKLIAQIIQDVISNQMPTRYAIGIMMMMQIYIGKEIKETRLQVNITILNMVKRS
jgi:hypothetical protein